MSRLVTDKKGLLTEIEGQLKRANPDSCFSHEGIKTVLLATINGAKTDRKSREVLGEWVEGGSLDKFQREMHLIRDKIIGWCPNIAHEVRRANPGATEYFIKSRTLFFAMTHLEDKALRLVEEEVRSQGLSGDAPTGDGILVTIRDRSQASPSINNVLQGGQSRILQELGIHMTLSVKSLDGRDLSAWPWVHTALDARATPFSPGSSNHVLWINPTRPEEGCHVFQDPWKT